MSSLEDEADASERAWQSCVPDEEFLKRMGESNPPPTPQPTPDNGLKTRARPERLQESGDSEKWARAGKLRGSRRCSR